MLLGKRRFDPQPTTPAAVLLASSGSPFSRAAVRRAYELAGGEPVAVLSLEQRGCTVDGQVAATRSAGRMIAKVARARKVRYVVMDTPTATGVRKIIEGELTGIVRRRLRDGTTLELVDGQS